MFFCIRTEYGDLLSPNTGKLGTRNNSVLYLDTFEGSDLFILLFPNNGNLFKSYEDRNKIGRKMKYLRMVNRVCAPPGFKGSYTFLKIT